MKAADSSMQGRMTSTITLSDQDGGTLVESAHENLPPTCRPPATNSGGAWRWITLPTW